MYQQAPLYEAASVPYSLLGFCLYSKFGAHVWIALKSKKNGTLASKKKIISRQNWMILLIQSIIGFLLTTNLTLLQINKDFQMALLSGNKKYTNV